jgi:hypothetical protein
LKSQRSTQANPGDLKLSPLHNPRGIRNEQQQQQQQQQHPDKCGEKENVEREEHTMVGRELEAKKAPETTTGAKCRPGDLERFCKRVAYVRVVSLIDP